MSAVNFAAASSLVMGFGFLVFMVVVLLRGEVLPAVEVQ
jgi:hypothetical protein